MFAGFSRLFPKAAGFAARPALCLLVFASGGFYCAPSLADKADTLNASVSETVVRDDNLFRAPDGTAPMLATRGITARGDTIHAGSLKLNLDKNISLQHFHAGADVTDYRFGVFSFLDYRSKGFDARWDWALTPQLYGKFSTERTQSLNSFSDYRGYQRNLRTIEKRNATFEYEAFGAWRILGASGRDKVMDTYVLPTNSKSTDFTEAGIKYLSSSGNSVTLLGRASRISWLGIPLSEALQFDSAATEHDSEVRIDLPLSVRSEIQAVVTRLSRKHRNFSSRDYAGTAETFSYVWTPGAKTQILFSASRSYVDWWDVGTSYNITDSVSMMPTWQLSPEFSARLRVEKSRRSFYAPIYLPPGMPLRRDDCRNGQLNLEWLPLRNISVTASLQKERRDSNQEDLSYTDTLKAVHLQLSF